MKMSNELKLALIKEANELLDGVEEAIDFIANSEREKQNKKQKWWNW